MKALAWHGKRDVRVDTVPDPRIEEPTDAIVRITSTAICGSDLHLYEVLGPVPRRGRHPRPRADGNRGGGRLRGRAHQAGRPGRDPVQHLVRPLLDVRPGAVRPVRDHPGPTSRTRAPPCSATPSSTARCRAARPSSSGCRRRTSGPSRSPRARRTSASSTSRTSCPPPGRRWSTPPFPRAAASPSSAWARSARSSAGSPTSRGRRVIAVDLVPERLEMARRHGIETLDLRRVATSGTRSGADRRPGPDSTIDAVGMEAHGSPLHKAAQRRRPAADAIAAPGVQGGRHRPAAALNAASTRSAAEAPSR